MYYIAICDDDKNYINYMKKRLYESGLSDETAEFYECTSGEELINAIKGIEKIDLLILDMQMGKYDGNRTAKQFREQFPSSVIVFCSGVCLPTVESFETTPFRYLLKEYTDERMKEELKSVIREMKNKQIEPSVIGTFRYQDVKLKLDEILYISIARNGSSIHITKEAVKNEYDGQLTSRKKLKDLYEELKEYGFEYAHNSYIVNLNHIKRKTTHEIELSNGEKLSIARSKEKQLRQTFAKYKSQKY